MNTVKSPSHAPVWSLGTIPITPPLTSDTSADVCVIGAGIAGLSIAYELLQRGYSVVILDRGEIGGGETGRTSAHLASAVDDRFHILEHVHGPIGARMMAESHAAAIDAIEGRCIREGILCDFQRVDGYLFAAPGDDDVLIRELPAAHRAGLIGAEFVSRVPLPGLSSSRCIRFPNQAQFDPLAYLAGLARTVLGCRGRIHAGTHATSVTGGEHAHVMTTDGRRVDCASIVMATNVPINDRFVLQTKLEAYRSYVVALRIPHGSVLPALYWDTAKPYHYLRVIHDATGSDVLLVGGEDHKTGHGHEPAKHYGTLEQWARQRFPFAGAAIAKWSGQIIEPVDGVAYIGHNPMDHDNVYIHAGDSGNGLTHGTIAGMLIADLITGRPNRWEELYRPSRKSLLAGAEYVVHNADVAAQYTDWVTPGDVESTSAIAPGAGAVVRHGLHKFATYRDNAGELHECSATCPHLGGLVRWNAAEGTWDCPCHGSRFDAYGRVLNGPANADLHMLSAATHR